MSCCYSSHRKDGLDDSFEAESFRSQIKGNRSEQKWTHGSCLSSNACAAPLPGFDGPPEARSNLRDRYRSMTSQASYRSNDQPVDTDSGSGVLVDSPKFWNQLLPQDNEGTVASKAKQTSASNTGVRHPFVSAEGSPFPHDARARGKEDHLVASTFGRSDFVHNETSTGNSGNKNDHDHGISCPSAFWNPIQCEESICNPPQSEKQARYQTAPSRPSEIGVDASGECLGCGGRWGGCEESCPPWPTTVAAAPAAHSLAESTCFAGSPAYERKGTPTLLSRDYYKTHGKKRAVHKQTGGVEKCSQQATARRPTAVPSVLEGDHRLRNEQDQRFRSVEHEQQRLDPRLDMFNTAFESDLRSGLGTPEQTVKQHLRQPEGKPNQTVPIPQHRNGHNNVASIAAGDHAGCAMTRADLDLRDLNKQVLKMSLYEKLKREQALSDRLTRIEQQLSTKQLVSKDAKAHVRYLLEIQDLHAELALQRREFAALKKEAQLMPEIRGELVNLNNESMWQRDRINNLENIACDQQRAAELIPPRDASGTQGIRYAEVPHADAATFDDAPSWDVASDGSRCEDVRSAGIEDRGGWERYVVGSELPHAPHSQANQGLGPWGPQSRPSAWSKKACDSGFWVAPPSQRGGGWERSSEHKDQTAKSVHSSNGWPSGNSQHPPSLWAGFATDHEREGSNVYSAGCHGDYGAGWYPPSPQLSFDGFKVYDHSPQHFNRSGWGSAQSKASSWDNCSRTPTVETIPDSEARGTSSKQNAQNSASSWETMDSQRQTFHDGKQGSSTSHARYGNRRRNDLMGAASSPAPSGRSNKQSRDFWRRPTTPSKWDGETDQGGWDASMAYNGRSGAYEAVW